MLPRQRGKGNDVPKENIPVVHNGKTYQIQVDDDFYVEAAAAFLEVRAEVVTALVMQGNIEYSGTDEKGEGYFSTDDLAVIAAWLRDDIESVAEYKTQRGY